MTGTANDASAQREREGAFGHLISRAERVRLGRLLREVRSERGLRQVDLARRLGVPQAVVSKMETGHRVIGVLELRAICATIGVPVEAFVQRLDDVLAETGF